MDKKHIYFTVTNDLSFDQRMHRICGSLASAGYNVTLVGRKLKHSIPLENKNFKQERISCFFSKGFLFYVEYNLRLLVFLSGRSMDAICAIDLDTILPVLFFSGSGKVKRIYDAHEYFTELKEVRTRPLVKKIWKSVERFALSRFHHYYTVSEGLADAFYQAYGKKFEVIRNMPVLKPLPELRKENKFLYYQGAVNEARGFEFLIPAMKNIPYQLVVCGDGNFMSALKVLIKENGVEEKIILKGMMLPQELSKIASGATLGLGLAEKEGLNQFMALPNKFFDYIHAGLPQIAMNYPEYRKINDKYEVAVLVDDLEPGNISSTINMLMLNDKKLSLMHVNCLKAREVFNWQREEIKLLDFYKKLFDA